MAVSNKTINKLNRAVDHVKSASLEIYHEYAIDEVPGIVDELDDIANRLSKIAKREREAQTDFSNDIIE